MVSRQSWRLLGPGKAEACQGSSPELPSMSAQVWARPTGAEKQGGAAVSPASRRQSRGSSGSGLGLSQATGLRVQASRAWADGGATWNVTGGADLCFRTGSVEDKVYPGFDHSEASVCVQSISTACPHPSSSPTGTPGPLDFSEEGPWLPQAWSGLAIPCRSLLAEDPGLRVPGAVAKLIGTSGWGGGSVRCEP